MRAFPQTEAKLEVVVGMRRTYRGESKMSTRQKTAKIKPKCAPIWCHQIKTYFAFFKLSVHFNLGVSIVRVAL